MSQDLYSNISSEQILSQLKLHFSGEKTIADSLLKTYLNILKERGVLTDDLIINLKSSILKNEIKVPPARKSEQNNTEERLVTFKEYYKFKKEVSSAGMSLIYACVWAFVALASSLIGAGIAASGELAPRELPDVLMTTSIISGIALIGFFVSIYSAGVKLRDVIPQK